MSGRAPQDGSALDPLPERTSTSWLRYSSATATFEFRFVIDMMYKLLCCDVMGDARRARAASETEEHGGSTLQAAPPPRAP